MTHKHPYRADIDGLRACAITSVVLFHAGAPFVRSGFVGVDIFFAISGYLIGGIIFREVHAGSFRFAHFYARRARRILPALIGVIATCCAAGLALLDQAELTELASSSGAALAGVSNIKFFLHNDYFENDSSLLPMLMTWSLGVEEQFYLLFPFLLLAMARMNGMRTGYALLFLSLMSFACCVIVTRTHPAAAFYLLPLRAWELGLGALLAVYHERHPPASRQAGKHFANIQGAVGLALLALSVTVFDDHTPFPGAAAALPVCGALLLLHAPSSWINRAVLSARPVVFVGLVSYSWYLWHWPLMTFARLILTDKPALSLMLAIAAISFLLAYASWRWVEQPFRKPRHNAQGTLWRFGASLALTLACTMALKISGGLPLRLPQPARHVEEMVALGRGACLAAFGATGPVAGAECQPANDGTPAIALWGDSHASALGPGLKALAHNRQLRLLQFNKSSCTPLLDMSAMEDDHPNHAAECGAFNRRAMERITQDASITTVIVAAYWPKEESYRYLATGDADNGRPVNAPTALRKGLPALLQRLAAAGKHVIVVGDVPRFTFNPARYAITQAMPARRWLADRLQPANGLSSGAASPERVFKPYREAGDIIRASAANTPNVTFTDLYAQFCTPAGCRFQEDGNGDLLFIDSHHLSQAGSARVRWELPGVR